MLEVVPAVVVVVAVDGDVVVLLAPTAGRHVSVGPPGVGQPYHSGPLDRPPGGCLTRAAGSSWACKQDKRESGMSHRHTHASEWVEY